MKTFILTLVLILSVNCLFSQESKTKKPEPVKTEKVSKIRTWKFQKTNDGYIIVKKDFLFSTRKTVVA